MCWSLFSTGASLAGLLRPELGPGLGRQAPHFRVRAARAAAVPPGVQQRVA